jgi:hypothetical protein
MLIGIWKAIAFIVGVIILLTLLIFVAALLVVVIEEIIKDIIKFFSKK